VSKSEWLLRCCLRYGKDPALPSIDYERQVSLKYAAREIFVFILPLSNGNNTRILYLGAFGGPPSLSASKRGSFDIRAARVYAAHYHLSASPSTDTNKPLVSPESQVDPLELLRLPSAFLNSP
jgi:hypothetical protein